MVSIYIIAEAGVNHNGDVQRALAMVDAAAAAGADAVKFQTFRPEALASRHAAQADYQLRNEGDSGSQLAMLQRLTLDFDVHHQLLRRCQERGIDFLSSPFDTESARFLMEDLTLPRLKLGSGELTNAPLLLQIARAGRELILSTGMATLDEVQAALEVLAFGYSRHDEPRTRADYTTVLQDPDVAKLLRDQVTLLHCTTEYPCPLEQVNLRVMDTLREATGLAVGYSDHTLGIQISVAAAARGATVLEKHFTLDRSLPGPDHVASLEPDELAALVSAVRDVSRALGDPVKTPGAVELKNAAVVRKSLVAAAPIRAGESFNKDNLTVKRPGNGRSPMDYWDLLGQSADKDYGADEVIS
ncbi:N-acetylneuraminate synthase [Candidatus Tenderia electrophaga]|jgi:N-acetylneuraminate synthase|uniref:N-acetylneuraminate synthase n=1 Tax=Candidatus Tenderia electrophaga TaxID=1748243 RepID=A0A0S2TC34_9GAMM|nr:N-acetylneuraminate synthase [Candidatus Tenderia electrophaga]